MQLERHQNTNSNDSPLRVCAIRDLSALSRSCPRTIQQYSSNEEGDADDDEDTEAQPNPEP
jgi:hypothetical protein